MKKTFKDFVQSDITAAFMKQDEFAETAIINDEEMIIVFDDDEVNPADKSKKVVSYDVLFHVASSYFEHIPMSGKMMDFNGEEYFIKRASENMGMLTIGLSRHES